MTNMTYKDLKVWQKSLELSKQIYKTTLQLPSEEKFGITSQIQRSAVSIPSNIAEGQQRNNLKEYRHFLGIAKGSCAELETQLLIITDVYRVDCAEELALLTEIQKMLTTLLKKLEPNT